MHAEFAAKLRLTAAVLGCTTRKDLCARFRAVNPATPCDLDRLHKWVQGRALPRSPQLFSDWARVLGTERSGAWLAACTLAAFRGELALLFGPSAEVLSDAGPAHAQAGHGARILGGERTLCGAFACYSHAWSPRYRGRLIRGSLRIENGKADRLRVGYSEKVTTGLIEVAGEAVVESGALHVHLRNAAIGLNAFLTLMIPGPPASALCGILSGQVFLAHQVLPSATRFLAVRINDEDRLDASSRYFEPGREPISGDLEALGVPVGAAAELDRLANDFLRGGFDQVAPIDQAAFCGLLDDGYLRPAAGAPG